jgi:hypothetical protein
VTDDGATDFDTPPTRAERQRQNTRPLDEVHLPIGNVVDELRRLHRRDSAMLYLLLLLVALLLGGSVAEWRQARAFREIVMHRLAAQRG